MVIVNAKVITGAGARVLLSLVCPSRHDVDALIEQIYPDHRAAFLIVKRRQEVKPC